MNSIVMIYMLLQLFITTHSSSYIYEKGGKKDEHWIALNCTYSWTIFLIGILLLFCSISCTKMKIRFEAFGVFMLYFEHLTLNIPMYNYIKKQVRKKLSFSRKKKKSCWEKLLIWWILRPTDRPINNSIYLFFIRIITLL